MGAAWTPKDGETGKGIHAQMLTNCALSAVRRSLADGQGRELYARLCPDSVASPRYRKGRSSRETQNPFILSEQFLEESS